MTYTDLAAVVIVTGAALWSFRFYFTRPLPAPPPSDEARWLKVEHDLKDAAAGIASLKSAIGMRQLGPK